MSVLVIVILMYSLLLTASEVYDKKENDIIHGRIRGSFNPNLPWITRNERNIGQDDLCAFEGDILIKCYSFNHTTRKFPEKWPVEHVRPIKYDYNEIEFPPHEAKYFVDVLNYLSNATKGNVRFERVHGAYRETPSILFKKATYCGIIDMAGYKGDTAHDIYLYDTCLSMAVVGHLVMHVLGFPHEINHPDRDAYVHIYLPNIAVQDRRHFEKYPSNIKRLLRHDLDWTSVMMFDMNEYNVDQFFPVIIPLRREINPFDFQRQFRDESKKNNVSYIFSYTDLTKLRDEYSTGEDIMPEEGNPEVTTASTA